MMYPLPSQLVPLRPKYSPQHLGWGCLRTLKHPQPTFLPQCERPSLTPIRKTDKVIVS
jgi:hypothetical protein